MAHILFITQRVPYPPNKGEKLRTYHQIKYLRDLGHEISVFSPVENEIELKNAYQLANTLSINVVTQALPPKAIRYVKALICNRSMSESHFYSSALLDKIKQQLCNADVILCSASSLTKYVVKLLANTKTASKKPLLLMDFMDVDSDKWLQYFKSASWPMRYIYYREYKLVKKLEQKAMQIFDCAFVIAQAEYDLFQSSVCQCHNLKVLGNGIDQNEFFPSSEDHSNIHFLFTGVMDYKPNVDAVLWFTRHCWPKIKKEIPEAKLTIAGMNPEYKISALAKDKSIEITGFVNDIMPYFNRADIFIAPFQIARGVQNKVLQAMSCGIPVVSTTLGAEGIMVEDNENMLLCESSSEFIEACWRLANDKNMRSTIGSKANKTITEHYSWASILKPLKDQIDTQGSSK